MAISPSNKVFSGRLLILFLCQAFYWATTIFGIAFSSLAGMQLAPSPSLATLPVALLTVGALASTYSLSLCMQRYGRRVGFFIGALFMMLGAGVCVYGIYLNQFVWFCLGHILFGVAQASAFYYRLAATDTVAPEQRGRALAWVFSGGIVAALLAPAFGDVTKDLLLPYEFAGAYAVMGVLGFATAILLLFFPADYVTADDLSGSPRPLLTLLKQPALCLALLNAAVGHGVMILVMVATPLAIVACGFTIAESTSVIGVHVLGMFLPAFFSGLLIDRFGTARIAIAGALILMLSAIIAIVGINLPNFYGALFLLGVGWNLLYLSGSTAVTQCHRKEERGKVQGFSELVITSLAAVAAFSSGSLVDSWGWTVVQVAVLLILILTVFINLYYLSLYASIKDFKSD